MLVAVIGLATAAVVTVVPSELAAAVPEAPRAARGAAQLDRRIGQKIRGQTQRLALLSGGSDLLGIAGSIEYASSPRAIDYGLKWSIRGFIVADDFSGTLIAGEFFEFNWAVGCV